MFPLKFIVFPPDSATKSNGDSIYDSLSAYLPASASN